MTPEYRTCPVTGRVVILAPDRASRPIAMVHAEPHHREIVIEGNCPFCPGHESETPAAVLTYGEPDWQLRVVPNRFPAVVGYHDVVIECREHLSDPKLLSDEQLASVFRSYRERILTLKQNPTIQYVQAFKNVGAEAGASLGHSHSQILATPFVPEAVQQELNGALQYHQRTNRNVFPDMLGDDSRMVLKNDDYAVVCPYAPRFAYEMWLMPTRSAPCFETITDTECVSLAKTLKSVLHRLDSVLNNPAYNWLIHTAPAGEPHFQWHLEIIPRTDRAAGYEWATGVFINTVTPETAAERLRSVPLSPLRGEG